MAPINLTELIGDYDRAAPVSITPPILARYPANAPPFRNPIFLVPFSIILVITVLFTSLLVCGCIYTRREKRRLARIKAEMWAAARRAGIEAGVTSDSDGMIMMNGTIYHYNYEKKNYEAVTEPQTPHFDSPISDSVAEAATRLLMLKMEKCWRDFRELFKRRS